MIIEGSAAVVGIGMLGGSLLEVLHWWKLRQRSDEFPVYARRILYWIVTAAMACSGGLLAWLYFGARAEAILAFHVGLSTPLLLEKMASSLPRASGARGLPASIRRFLDW